MNVQLRKRNRDFLFNRSKGRCEYCGEAVTRASMTIDHYLPIACGGSSRRLNLRCSCSECNERKGSMMPADWLNLMEHA